MQRTLKQLVLVLLLVLLLVPWTLAQFHQRFTFIRISPPNGIQSLQGLHQKIRCDASYLGETVDIAWYKNDQLIPDTNPRYNIDESTNRLDTASFSILTIMNTKTTDSGRYSCHMLDPGRGVAAVVVMIYEHPIVIGSPGQMLAQGDNTTLTCEVVPDMMEYGAKIFWHKEGRFVGTRGLIDMDGNGSPDVNIEPIGNLTIINPQTLFGGTYTCRIRYMLYGKINYVTGDMKVYINTTVRTEPYNWYNANARRPLQLQCMAEGFPYADIAWSYNGVPVRGGDMRNNVSLLTKPLDHVTMLSTLTIRELPGSFNVTKYTCTARNQFGTDQIVGAVINTEQIFRPFGSDASVVKQSAALYCLSFLLGILLLV